ncbi:hypothetical protein CWE09_10145 [Aliidiomarina minuta]|uniref:Prepilin-type cleavage/methylation domain-containing protein n=1 Tax=Aliidiomarina minuta TaxID=880057 RepID=A0A432WA89_9GAMM|nr:prepilin-type N-terminal cleavage/methylation domain-containing protein [Aliidiomarina minuta]RUO27029.1 hypothetical protein CWE09_10145 [Aliidiomarina minuta]
MKQGGFTLVELIIVILILGILAVSAAPQFFNYSTNAEHSAIQSLSSALKSGVELTHYQASIRQLETENMSCLGGKFDTADGNCSENGILLRFGYPAASVENLNKVVNLNDWEHLELSTGNAITFARTSEKLSTECRVIYRYDDIGVQAPTIETRTNQC